MFEILRFKLKNKTNNNWRNELFAIISHVCGRILTKLWVHIHIDPSYHPAVWKNLNTHDTQTNVVKRDNVKEREINRLWLLMFTYQMAGWLTFLELKAQLSDTTSSLSMSYCRD